jgi:protein-tyrosine phosphatase
VDGYRILMVCTGNICRSPLMERLFVARLSGALPPAEAARFSVSSAGTWAVSGEPMSAAAAETLVALGGDPCGFVAHDLDPATLAATDLILAAAREHRALVVSAEPRVADRTVTVRELARLLRPVPAGEIDRLALRGDPVDRMRALAAAAFANRGLVPLDDPNDDDVPDPYGRDHAAYLRAASLIDAALAVPLGLLLAGSGSELGAEQRGGT